jgi:uncharacterized protein (DUF433 family)
VSTAEAPAIQKTPGVCGGAARIANHRITVAHLVWYRKRGMSNEKLLEAFPTVTKHDLAGNVPDGTDPATWVIVAGLLLGIPEAEIRAAFQPPLTEERIAAAWDDYWGNPAAVEQDIARYRRAG